MAFALMQALSPPFDYINAGKPLHPVASTGRTARGSTGGAFSVVARTRWWRWRWRGCSSGRPAARCATLAPLASPPPDRRGGGRGRGARRSWPSRIWDSALDRSAATGWWWLAAFVGVAATQLIGFGAAPPGVAPAPAWPWLASVGGGHVSPWSPSAPSVWSRGWDQGDLGPAMGRSLIITVLITGAQVVTSILAAYAFAFLRFPFKTLVFAVFMGTLLLPLEVTLLANVQTIRELGWINSQRRAGAAVRGHRVRHVPHPPGLPRRAARDPGRHPPRRLRPHGVPVAASRCP